VACELTTAYDERGEQIFLITIKVLFKEKHLTAWFHPLSNRDKGDSLQRLNSDWTATVPAALNGSSNMAARCSQKLGLKLSSSSMLRRASGSLRGQLWVGCG